jgi:predicted amidohydrolase
MTAFSIAVAQVKAANGDNVEAMLKRIDSVMRTYPWVQMMVFGELLARGYDLGAAQALPGPGEDAFRDAARRHGIWLVPGSAFIRDGNQVFNTATAIDPEGEIVARYRKIFPFYPYEAGVSAGDEVCTFEVPGVARFGLGICYDKWFPETTRQMVWDGAEVILQPTATGTIDRDVELAMVRSLAAMNQCYYLDVNNAGEMGVGRSIVCGPEGDILHQCGVDDEVAPVVIDLERVRRVRRIGMQGLGQVLKSARDSTARFTAFQRDRPASPTLDGLGRLAMPRQSDITGPGA